MSLYEEFTYDYENGIFWNRHKLSNGQFCMICFEESYNDNQDVITYNVVFAIADKKKQLRGFFSESKENTITLKSTGRCGVEALRWAKDNILLFENYMRKKYRRSDKTIAIIVGGEDNRRFRLYEKGLSRYGYRKTTDDYFSWVMRKTLVRNGKPV